MGFVTKVKKNNQDTEYVESPSVRKFEMIGLKSDNFMKRDEYSKLNPTMTLATSNSTADEESENENLGNDSKDIELQKSSPSMQSLPYLVDIIAKSDTISETKIIECLHLLVILSSQNEKNTTETLEENRKYMASYNGCYLVTKLLDFLRCSVRGSKEQYLALLVLNNLSIPPENKRLIAIDCGGAKLLSRLLCEDVSCELISIILVNLSFADHRVRLDLLDPNSSIQLLDTISFVLQLLTLSPKNYKETIKRIKKQILASWTPRHFLSVLNVRRKKEPNLHRAHNLTLNGLKHSDSNLLQTAKWCICIVKNITRPFLDETTVRCMMGSNFIQRLSSLISIDSKKENIRNDPYTWDSNSMQDSALYVLLYLTYSRKGRLYLNQHEILSLLSSIVTYSRDLEKSSTLIVEQKQFEFQVTKARMALAILISSEDLSHQGKSESITPNLVSCTDESVVMITGSECQILLELVANVLHQRSKEGSGGYSHASFNFKMLMVALRSMLNFSSNVKHMGSSCGVGLNCLLLKALMFHLFHFSDSIDKEAAEHTCFSLYLLSACGINAPFLPSSYSEDLKGQNVLRKVMQEYISCGDASPHGTHAANQILSRLNYIRFKGSIKNIAVQYSMKDSDFELDSKLVDFFKYAEYKKIKIGAKPTAIILDEVIVRTDYEGHSKTFPNALIAAQQLSVKILTDRTNAAVDDIHIAKGIVKASHKKNKSYCDFFWSFQEEGAIFYSDDETEDEIEEETSDTKQSTSYFDYLFCNFNTTTDT